VASQRHNTLELIFVEGSQRGDRLIRARGRRELVAEVRRQRSVAVAGEQLLVSIGGFLEVPRALLLEDLGDGDLQRKACIPLFSQFMGTDEITIPVYVGALFDFHWNDHAGQIAKIRKAAGLPDA